MTAIVWDTLKELISWFMSLRVNRCVYCQYCEDCKAYYKIPGPGGVPVPICKHCIKKNDKINA